MFSILIGSLNLGYELIHLSLTLYGKRLFWVCQAIQFSPVSGKMAEKSRFRELSNTKNAGKCFIGGDERSQSNRLLFEII